MNTPNKLTVLRMILVPFFMAFMMIDIKNIPLVIIGLIIFVVASITDAVDGNMARKHNMVTDFGKMMDAISDKLLTNSLLIILASEGKISVVIAVVIIIRDIVVDSIKMVIGNKDAAVAAIGIAKWKTATLMIGIALTLFYNLPFEIWNIAVADVLLLIATVLSVVSGVQYYTLNKHLIMDK